MGWIIQKETVGFYKYMLTHMLAWYFSTWFDKILIHINFFTIHPCQFCTPFYHHIFLSNFKSLYLPLQLTNSSANGWEKCSLGISICIQIHDVFHPSWISLLSVRSTYLIYKFLFYSEVTTRWRAIRNHWLCSLAGS